MTRDSRLMWNWVILYQFHNECSDLCYFLHATILSALCFFSPHSPAVSVRTQAAHWLPLALLGGEKKIMQKRIAASQKI